MIDKTTSIDSDGTFSLAAGMGGFGAGVDGVEKGEGGGVCDGTQLCKSLGRRLWHFRCFFSWKRILGGGAFVEIVATQ